MKNWGDAFPAPNKLLALRPQLDEDELKVILWQAPEC